RQPGRDRHAPRPQGRARSLPAGPGSAFVSEGPSSSPVLELHFELRTLDEVRISQAPIRRFAAELGFDRAAQWQVTIAASEAGTNMVKYGGGGRLTLRRIVEPRVGLRLEARDHGPGI